MFSRLPRWVEYGAFLLALLAGMVNVTGLLSFDHQAVSHVSGTATHVGVAIVEGDRALGHLVGILIAFLAGATVSGAMIDGTALRLGRSYGVALALEGGLLLIALFALHRFGAAGEYFASAACGLQNGLITTYSGAVIRTTHLTGLFTDLGLMVGQRVRGRALDRRRGLLYLVIIFVFILGGSVGALVFRRYGVDTLLVPASIAFALAFGHTALVRRELKRDGAGNRSGA